MSFDVYTIDLSSINLSLSDLISVKHGAGTTKYVPISYLYLINDMLKNLISFCGDDETSVNSSNFVDIEDFLLRIKGEKK